MDAPFAKGVPNVIVPTLSDELTPPPRSCAGGISSVTPCTATLHGVGPPQVVASLTPATTVGAEVRARKSAEPGAAGVVVMSTMRKRRRVRGAPVLLVNLRRK